MEFCQEETDRIEKERKLQDVEFRQKEKDRIEKERKHQETEFRQKNRQADTNQMAAMRSNENFRRSEKIIDKL